jgi:ATP-dependent Clp protease adaptor protein ClpS
VAVFLLQPTRTPPVVAADAREDEDARRQQPVKVVLHNDDYTPADYVVRILQEEFGLGWWKANWIMAKAHVGGQALVGVYDREEAQARVSAATRRARADGWPLRLSIEGAE